MNWKTVAIIAAAILALAGLAAMRRKKEEGDIASPDGGCIQKRPGKFLPWEEANVPGGDLNRIAAKYLPELDPGPAGSVVGGFFKAIDVFPSDGAARYYSTQLKKWSRSNEGLPYWQVVNGELLCPN